MKVQAKITSSQQLPDGTFRFYLEFESDKRGFPQHLDVTIPDPPPVKSDGQKAYEADPPAIPWDDLSAHHRNLWHRAAAAVTGKPPVVETELAPVKSPGERFFLAYLNGGAYTYNWRTMGARERLLWLERAHNYEASK